MLIQMCKNCSWYLVLHAVFLGIRSTTNIVHSLCVKIIILFYYNLSFLSVFTRETELIESKWMLYGVTLLMVWP